MRWRALESFRDRSIAKLDHLRRGRRGGLSVPPTRWVYAADIDPTTTDPPSDLAAPWILRSGSPTEDRTEGTAAGRFVTEVVETDSLHGFREALARVVDALPTEGGARLGAVFVRSEERRVGKECRSRWSPYH